MNITIRNMAYNIEVAGDPSVERAVVLLHGFSGSGADWEDLIPRLRGMERSAITIDLAGHGKTAATEDLSRYTMPETVRDLDEIMEVIGVAEADWVGYSMGGRVALHVALACRARVRSLVLESASPGIEDSVARNKRRWADEALAVKIEERGIEWFADYWGAQPLFETQRKLPPATLLALRERRRANRRSGLARSLRGMGQGVHDYVGGRLASLTCPSLFIAGARDPKYAEIARSASDAVPGSRCVIVPQAGHAVHLEAPLEFAEALAAHWNISELRPSGVAIARIGARHS
jgi:2-succinyl-6-hydroxy-2,4-cyclohexadiene-1-carboxylate synthase